MPGWVTKIKRPTDVSKKKPQPTWPVGEELVGFESLLPPQAEVSGAVSGALLKQLQGPAPAPFRFKPFEYAGVSPADVGSLQSMLRSLGTGGADIQRTLQTLMAGAEARPTGDISGILAGIPTFGGELGVQTRGALETALRSEFPEEYFQTAIARPAREEFEEERAPAIREEFAGPGTFWGTARAGEVTGERGKMERNLTAIRGELGEEAQKRSLQAAATSMSARQNQIQMALSELSSQRAYATGQQQIALNAAIAQLQKQQSGMTTAMSELNRLSQGKYQEIAMAQERYLTEMRTTFEEYTRRHPGMSEALQAALSYLNIPMLATYQPYEESGKDRWVTKASVARTSKPYKPKTYSTYMGEELIEQSIY